MASLTFYRSVTVVLSFFAVFPLINAFTFSFAEPSQCDDLALTWTGGSPPFTLNLIPVFGTPLNVSIPASSYNDGKGSFSFPLPFSAKAQLAFMMSDATGFNAGGVSEVKTVQPSKGGTCDTTEPKVDFSFQLNTALQQCRPYVIEGYKDAVQPVTIYIIVPGGNVTILNPPVGPTSFTWNANAARGTSMIFMLTDAKGRQGGSSDVIPVNVSDDTSCLNTASPSTTSNPPSSSSTSSSSPDSSPTSNAKDGISIAAVAGTVIGALIFLAVTITLGLFFLKRKREDLSLGYSDNKSGSHASRRATSHGQPYDPGFGSGAPYSGGVLPSDFPPASPYTYPPNSSVPLGSNPFLDTHSEAQNTTSSQHLLSPSGHYQPNPFDSSSDYLPAPPGHYLGTYQSQFEPTNPSGPSIPPGMGPEAYSLETRTQSSIPMSTNKQKAALAGSATQRPTRFIVHTDVEDDLPPPNADGVVELPPQYSERRRAPGSANPLPEQAGPSPGSYPL